MTRAFNITGSASSVVVTFSGLASLSGSEPFDTGFIRLTIDNAQQTPGRGAVHRGGSIAAPRQLHLADQAAVTVGAHTARIQWRTDLGSSFCLDARSLIVLHR